MRSPWVPLPPSRPPRLRPLHWTWVLLSAVAVVIVGTGVGWWLWRQADGLAAADLARARADAIRTGLTAAGGTGAALALLLAVRRQRSTEVALDLTDIDLAQKKQAAADAAHDATERRITDLYTKAAEQLSSDKAAVQLAGVLALERLAQGAPELRQTVVDLLCAHIRMTPSAGKQSANDMTNGSQSRLHSRIAGHRRKLGSSTESRTASTNAGEIHVRATARDVLLRHLRYLKKNNRGLLMEEKYSQVNGEHWDGIRLDLSNTTLTGWDLTACRISAGTFAHTTFADRCDFTLADFTDDVDFTGSTFLADASFYKARIGGNADFSGATFHKDAHFEDMDASDGHLYFEGSLFEGMTWFDDADICYADFRQSEFLRECYINRARFGSVSFYKVVFTIKAHFGGATFRGQTTITSDLAILDGTRITKIDGRNQTWPPSYTVKAQPDGSGVLERRHDWENGTAPAERPTLRSLLSDS
ncbi:pentapeptide repeat-containing protein [Amycolatopsis sp. NPDC059021]|uniref:pentapeptide repeat-containing protein n=1 Tax=Amycolatopsis sp. NPDC059021 TaxID=3346704 RepID=UPI00366E0CEF